MNFMAMMKAAFGRAHHPADGQLWRSAHSGRLMQVTEVIRADDGSLTVWAVNEGQMYPTIYARSIFDWRVRLARERREFTGLHPRVLPKVKKTAAKALG